MLYILYIKSGANRIASFICDELQLAESKRACVAAGLSYSVEGV